MPELGGERPQLADRFWSVSILLTRNVVICHGEENQVRESRMSKTVTLPTSVFATNRRMKREDGEEREETDDVTLHG